MLTAAERGLGASFRLSPAQFLFAKALVHRAALKNRQGGAEEGSSPRVDLVVELRPARDDAGASSAAGASAARPPLTGDQEL